MAGHFGNVFGHGGHQAPPPVSPHAPQGQYGAPAPAPAPHRPEHEGPLVTVVSEAGKNYRLTSRPDGVVLAYKNQRDPAQYWMKLDYGDKFTDEDGMRAFVLVNKATGQALSHGSKLGDAVTQEQYIPNGVDNSVLWSQGGDMKGFTTIRLVTNIHLTLDADHGDKKHGGIKEGNRLVVHTWNKQDNQKWLIAAVGPED